MFHEILSFLIWRKALLFDQGFKIFKISPVYKIIQQNEGYNKCNGDISFGDIVRAVPLHCIMV